MVTLGDDLCADQHVVAMRRDRLDQLGSGARPGQLVADHQRDPSPGKPRLGLLPDPLDPGPARYEAAAGEAFRAERRHGLRMAAMVALQPAGEAVLDEPGGAARTLHAMTTRAAQGQG